MMSIAVDMSGFAYLLKKQDFDAVADHIIVTFLMKSKTELPTTVIKRLFEILNVYFLKEKKYDSR